MTVITISRQFGSGGDEVAKQVCSILGYRLFDKKLVIQAASETGLSEDEIIDYSEDNIKIRNFLDRVFGRAQPVAHMRVWRENAAGELVAEQVPLSEQSALDLMQKAILSAYTMDNVVILGRGGQVILKDHEKVLHVRVDAPMESRIQNVKQLLRQDTVSLESDIDLRRRAQDLIAERDYASAEYIQRFYSRDWNDPDLYHIVINTDKLGIERAAQFITSLIDAL